MRRIDKGRRPPTNFGGKNGYRKAIPILREKTGPYCHFCEMRVDNHLSIEHILPQEHFPQYLGSWPNFLLACGYCNSSKGNQIPNPPFYRNYLWPQFHDTQSAYLYSITGEMRVASSDETPEAHPAQSTLDLYRLERITKPNGEQDPRCQLRLEAWQLALERKKEWKEQKVTAQAIVDMAIKTGFFSVWYAVFQDYPRLQDALKDAFPGTR